MSCSMCYVYMWPVGTQPCGKSAKIFLRCLFESLRYHIPERIIVNSIPWTFACFIKSSSFFQAITNFESGIRPLPILVPYLLHAACHRDFTPQLPELRRRKINIGWNLATIPEPSQQPNTEHEARARVEGQDARLTQIGIFPAGRPRGSRRSLRGGARRGDPLVLARLFAGE